jgi:hypothetical protein
MVGRQEIPMLCAAPASHLAAVVHAAPPEAVQAQPRRKDEALEPRRILSPVAQARLEAVLARFDVIDGGLAVKMRF